MTQPIDTEAATEAFLRLIETIKTLKSPGGCAWDAKQTPQSLRRYFMEEVCEVLEALDNEDAGRLEEELGDIMIHVLFQTDIAERSGEFSFAAVADSATEKLRRRHPHVFGDKQNRTPEEVEASWEEIKRSESKRNSILKELPPLFPALAYAAAIQSRVEKVGLEWDTRQLPEPTEEMDPTEREQLAGDILMRSVNRIRQLGIEPESALRAAANRLKQRVQNAESHANDQPLDQLPPDQRQAAWDAVAK